MPEQTFLEIAMSDYCLVLMPPISIVFGFGVFLDTVYFVTGS